MIMQATQRTLYFGDFHFHTHYSDNRDRASIEEMLLTGRHYHLSIFGTADHNHNLDAEKWRQTQEETAALRKQYPDMLLLNNCEITFLIGHFNVLLPERVTGTLAEGYQYLYLNSGALKIINHPFESNDEWYKRIIPDAIGIEVVNGSVFKHARKQGFRISSAIQIPSIQVYATYLALHLPVAAIGGSDAHQKAELGYGLTGFWLDSRPDTQSVIRAIQEYRTFATTLSGIVLDWSFEAETGLISWHVDWNTESSAFHGGATVELYCGVQKLYTTTDSIGAFSVAQAGFYWIAVFKEAEIAVSSPIEVGKAEGLSNENAAILTHALDTIRQDLTWLTMDSHAHLQPPSETFSQTVEIPVMTDVDFPHIIDRHGRPVPYDVIGRHPARVIIEKDCDVHGFNEFYIWLTRNELHEYVFVDIRYAKIGRTFSFNGQLLPGKMVCCDQIDARYRDDVETIWGLLDDQTRCNVHVETYPTIFMNIQLDSTRFPYRLCEPAKGIDSLLVYIAEDAVCPAHLLERVKKVWPAWADGNEAAKPLQERIYQLFVCAEKAYETI